MQSYWQERGPAILTLSLTQFSAYNYACICPRLEQTGALTFPKFLSRLTMAAQAMLAVGTEAEMVQYQPLRLIRL